MKSKGTELTSWEQATDRAANRMSGLEVSDQFHESFECSEIRSAELNCDSEDCCSFEPFIDEKYEIEDQKIEVGPAKAETRPGTIGPEKQDTIGEIKLTEEFVIAIGTDQVFNKIDVPEMVQEQIGELTDEERSELVRWTKACYFFQKKMTDFRMARHAFIEQLLLKLHKRSGSNPV